MPWEVTSYVLTKKDPNRRGVKPANTNSGVMLGQRRLHPGESALIGDAFYLRNKKTMDRYIELGLVSIKKLPDRTQPEEQVVSGIIADLGESPELVVALIDIVDTPAMVDVINLDVVASITPIETISTEQVEATTDALVSTITAGPAVTIPETNVESLLPQKRVVKRVGKNAAE